MHTIKSAQELDSTVIQNGYCVGCGACSVPQQSPFKMVMDDYGQYQAVLTDANSFVGGQIDYEKLCPFGAAAPNEDEIASEKFSGHCDYNSEVGFYNQVFAGHVVEGDFRNRGSSGGMGTWVLNELLQKGLVDHIVHVKSEVADQQSNDILFKYMVSDTLDETQQGSKSRYYPIELSEVLKTVRSNPGNYAVVGLPCFIKSVRLLQAEDHILAERIKYCVGLVCGHLKSSHYAQSLAWQMGIVPEELKAIDFRAKDPSQPANLYKTYVKGDSGENVAPSNNLFGTDWGAGAFKYKACDFCDDVFAETADVVLGDAWLPEYVEDSFGTNIVVTRNEEIRHLIVTACTEGRLEMDHLSVREAAKSQDAGIRHRKNAIGFRLYCEQILGSWIPKKRTAPVASLSPRHEMKRQRLRSDLRVLSHEAFLVAKATGEISNYLEALTPVYNRYKRVRASIVPRLLSFLVRKFKAIIVPNISSDN